MHHPPTQCPDTHQCDSLIHHAQVVLGIGAPEARIGRAPKADQFTYRHVPDIGLLRQYHTDPTAQLLIRIGREFTPFDDDLSRRLGLEGRKRAQQCRFPHAVSTQQTGQFPATDRPIDPFGHYSDTMLGGIADAEVLELNIRPFHHQKLFRSFPLYDNVVCASPQYRSFRHSCR